jgi:hypothetical protein
MQMATFRLVREGEDRLCLAATPSPSHHWYVRRRLDGKKIWKLRNGGFRAVAPYAIRQIPG